MHSRTFVGALLLIALASACGYSEQEWQAQLSKYQRLQASNQEKDAKIAQVTRDMEAERQRVIEIQAQLRSLGVDLQSKENQVAELAATLEERERALEEYRARAKQLLEIKARFEALRQKLDELTRLGLAVEIRKNRMVISLPGDVLFDSGRETLKKDGKEILVKVAAVIQGDPSLKERDYQVAGHTDNKPLKGGIYRDNWGLSLMRAREVLVFLVGEKGGQLPTAHWSAAGFGDTDPVASNDTAEGRQQNRRCDLIVVPSVEEMLDLKAIAK